MALPSTWIHFRARFDGVHAAGYNSAESEPIWVKFWTLSDNFGGWPQQTLGAIRAVATVWEGAEKKMFFFGQVNNARFHRFPVGQFSRILHTTTSIGVAM